MGLSTPRPPTARPFGIKCQRLGRRKSRFGGGGGRRLKHPLGTLIHADRTISSLRTAEPGKSNLPRASRILILGQ